MDKMKMETKDITQENIEKIGEMFPQVITESRDENGGLRKAINFELLKQYLSDEVVEGREAYEFTWVGKKESIIEANKPIRKTLRPCIEESKNWENTENLYIEGDNLEVLKLLQESYFGKVKMIYIDPPYNTGTNLIYKNNFFTTTKEYLHKTESIDEEGRLVINSKTNGRFHSDWCSMIYARLLIARKLLAKDGMIVLTIDDSEIYNVTSIMNEVFGEENHLATIVIKNNPSGRSTVSGASISHEYALFYGTNPSVKLGRLPHSQKQIARYKEQDEAGLYEWVNFRKHGGFREDAPSMYYPIFIDQRIKDFRIPKMKWNDSIKEYTLLEYPSKYEKTVYPIDSDGRKRRWKWSLERALAEKNDMTVRLDSSKRLAVYIKSRLKDEGTMPLTVWDKKLYSSTEYGTNLLNNLFKQKNLFDYPKSLFAVMDALRLSGATNGIYLDFFSGSSTTAHAIMKLNAEDGGNRKYIMVQLPEETKEASVANNAGYSTIAEIARERIRLSGEQILSDDHTNHPNIDCGFRVLKLDSSNMTEVYHRPDSYAQNFLDEMTSNIKSDRTDLDLLFGCLLEWGLPLDRPHRTETVGGIRIHDYDKGALVACFAEDLPEDVIMEIARKQPLRAVFRDASFADSPSKINVGEIFKLHSPGTDVRVL